MSTERDTSTVSNRDCRVDTSRLILAHDTEHKIRQVIDERHDRPKLARSGYHPKSKLLLWGRPDCGKTLTAYCLAEEFSLPVGVVRLNAPIPSILGYAGSRLQRVFNLSRTSPVILFLDEVGSVRKNRHDVGELKRVVNGFRQAMDLLFSTESLVVGASNHQDLLDPALWRRFDDVVIPRHARPQG